jgi:hypothetical protein
LPWFFCIAILPIAYVLSIGPATKMSHKGTLPPSLRIVYRPLVTVADHCPPFGLFLCWYIYRVWHCPFPEM